MTATDDLRRLLDERGVKWTDFRDQRCVTAWMEPAGAVRADEYDAGLLLVERVMTPEQAVAATLGKGKCRNVASVDYDYMPNDFRCSECGGIVASNSHSEPLSVIDVEDWSDGEWKFCPICGRMVVE